MVKIIFRTHTDLLISSRINNVFIFLNLWVVSYHCGCSAVEADSMLKLGSYRESVNIRHNVCLILFMCLTHKLEIIKSYA